MRFDISIIRFVFFAALVSAGYYLKPIDGRAWLSAVVGGVLAVLIIFFETRIRKASLKTLIGAAVGSILGIGTASLIAWIISKQKATGFSDEFKSFLTLTLTFLTGYVGLMVGA